MISVATPPAISNARTIRRIDAVAAARRGALVLHVLLVQVEHGVGLLLDRVERPEQLGEVHLGAFRRIRGQGVEPALRSRYSA